MLNQLLVPIHLGTGSSFALLDVLAVAIFLLGWGGYSFFADHCPHRQDSLLKTMSRYRLCWMQEMLGRENRMMDATIVGNILRSIAFFANTTIFILLGLVTMLGYREQASAVLSSIPFAQATSTFMWDMKMFLMIVIFSYAFFKYTWSVRQYNYAGIFIGAAPQRSANREEHAAIAQKGANLIGNAARHFNLGIRAYYFGLAALAWFVNSWLFMAATIWVIYVTYRREFRSFTLMNLAK